MDTKKLLIAMGASLVVMLLWQQFLVFLAKKNNWSMGPTTAPTTQQVASSAPSQAPQRQATGPEAVPATVQSVQTNVMVTTAPAQGKGFMLAGMGSEQTRASLGSGVKDDLDWAMKLDTSAEGAGLDSVVLNQFMLSVKGSEPYTFEQPYPRNPWDSRALATKWVSINGKSLYFMNVHWRLESGSAQSATYALDVTEAGKPVARLRKTYSLTKKQAKEDPRAYEVKLLQTVENLSDAPIKVKVGMNGVLPPLQENEGVDDRQILGAYGKDKDPAVTQVIPFGISEFTKEVPSKDLVKKDDLTLRWVGASSIYFDAIARPVLPSNGTLLLVGDVKAEALDPSSTDASLRDVVTTMETGELTLAPGNTGAMSLELFFGPKQRRVLQDAYYSAATTRYDLTLTTNQGWCGAYCAWQPVIDALVGLLRAFHFVTRDWGLAIICLVIVVRLALHPITKRSTISMQKMGKMGPEVERLKKKYGEDKDELNKAMMQLYKEQGFTPVLGCLPMFLQMPIWIALYNSLQNTFELRQAPFLWGFLGHWMRDLAKPDALVAFDHPLVVPFLGWHIYSLNLLPALMAVVFFLQQKYTPKPPAQTPEQAQQQKMMQWMSLLFPLLMYRMPSGLNLYILTSTTIGIIEAKRIRDHIKEREEAEKAGRIFVEGTKKMGRKKDEDNGAPKKASGPKTGLAGWIERLQSRADELQREQGKKQRRGGR